ncbi:hypothetical protein CVS40_3114 [Lucilia cuprina]|nr:hypothetical protein CVS40_3114 [Lucilia cuprina]
MIWSSSRSSSICTNSMITVTEMMVTITETIMLLFQQQTFIYFISREGVDTIEAQKPRQRRVNVSKIVNN